MTQPRPDALPGDPRFFDRQGPFSVAELAESAEAEIVGPETAAGVRLRGVAPLQAATSQEISFLDNRRYLPLLAETKAGAVILAPAFKDKLPEGVVGLVSKAPYLAWARIAARFHPVVSARAGVHPTAWVDESAILGEGVEIGPFATISARATIGDGTVIAAHTAIGEGVIIGAHNRIGTHVSISHAILGDRVTLYPGVRIGQDGFGFAVGPAGFETVPQLGRVILEHDVEIGANSTIDRGSMRDTIIGAGTRIDNLVQIGHNAQLGRCCIVVSQAGISGSTELGDFVTIAAQAGLIGHIKIGEKARVGAQCGVMSDVEAGADVIGSPAVPFREYFRNVAFLRRLAKKDVKGES